MCKLRSLSALLFVLLSGCVLLTSAATAQTTAPNEWTWVGGSSWTGSSQAYENERGVFGTFQVLAAGNIPDPTSNASAWTDSDGHLWLFGGTGNDLWEFDPVTNEWAWMAGPGYNCVYVCTNFGLYGTLGMPAAGNNPGQRTGATSWTDKNGKFWLFGGWGYGYSVQAGLGPLNDLWTFDPTTKQWEWVNGNKWPDGAGVYGAVGVPAVGNTPGGRSNAQGWTDKSGNLWLQGGQGYDATGADGNLADMWEFNPASNLWMWVSGSNTATDYFISVYGTQGVPAPGNTPGARLNSATWTDNSGNFWLFSGNASPSDQPNDLWEYNPSTGQWTWVAGSTSTTCTGYLGAQVCPDSGVYGTLGVAAPGNIPGARFSATTWTDQSGNFWLFGGEGLDTGFFPGLLNDLWEFNPSSVEWRWMGGSNDLSCPEYTYDWLCADPGAYGTLGTPSPSNVPVGRLGGAAWADKSGNFWIFGGQSALWGLNDQQPGAPIDGYQEYLNDLWEFQPSTAILPPALLPVFTLSAGTYTPPQTVAISNGMTNASFYYTTDGSTPTANSTLYTGPISLSTSSPSETLQAIAIVPGYINSGVASVSYTLTPEAPVFSLPDGTYTSDQTLTISEPSGGATLYWGCASFPTGANTGCSSANMTDVPYTGPITIGANEIIFAIARFPGPLNGPQTVASYTINLPPAASPTFSVPAGSYGGPQSLVLADSTPGASIYYTTDGSTPTINSTPYSGPISVAVSETIQAVATSFPNNFGYSSVASAVYAITQPNFSMKTTTPPSLGAGATIGNTSTITLTPANGFTGSVALTAAVTSSPTGAVNLPTLSFGATTPVSITSTAAGTATLTISTTAASTTSCSAMNQTHPPIPWKAGGGAALACLLLFGIPARRRKLRGLLGMLVLLGAFAGAAMGCGGGGGASNGGGGSSCTPQTVAGTTSGAYIITVTATSGAITQTGTVALTVQ